MSLKTVKWVCQSMHGGCGQLPWKLVDSLFHESVERVPSSEREGCAVYRSWHIATPLHGSVELTAVESVTQQRYIPTPQPVCVCVCVCDWSTSKLHT